MNKPDIIICGAGIAGIATAYYLSTRYGFTNILLVDRDQPMSYTTSKSGENYRDYWPQACMASFAAHSIDLMDEIADSSGNAFDLDPFGYDFISCQEKHEIFPSSHLRDAAHSGQLERISGRECVSNRFSYLADSVEQVVRIRRAGALDVYALGSRMLSLARKAGVHLKTMHIEKIAHRNGNFFVENAAGESLQAGKLVLAAGPMNRGLASILGAELDITSILQRKFVIPDLAAAIPRDMPFTIIADPQHLRWTPEEHELIKDDHEYQWLLDEFPAGLHIKPESTDQVKLGWAYNRLPEEPAWDPPNDFDFPGIVLRGASRYIPALGVYVDQPPTPLVQFSGYYTRTPENWPIIGPLEEYEGLFTVAALSGYGTMTACAAGDLVARWMSGESLPEYARHFHRNRYSDPEIMAEINAIESDGQL